MLRQQGLDWVFIDDKQRPEAMAFIDNHWVEVNQNASHSTEVCSKLKPLHDQACIALPAGKITSPNINTIVIKYSSNDHTFIKAQ